MDQLIDKIFKSHQECPECPSPKLIQTFFDSLLGLLFPEYALDIIRERKEVESNLFALQNQFAQILSKNKHLHQGDGDSLSNQFFTKLSEVFDLIHQDVDAMFAGDPASKSRAEILRCYPGFYAIAAYRISHEMYLMGIRMIPRIITEYAHSKTGIDIHPGASIGHHFCIDHGTGLVIGETTVIGNHVKLYQGVTLGALSVHKEDADTKRHPTIEDEVVIYAGATILGGNTVIGKGSVIGGNVWLTKSVPANSKIYYKAKMYDAGKDQTDLYVFKNDQD
ncbi:serine O-acetyltransferase [Belliella buryatensis]|uniref:Serine O-acetyltransferase n=1 Tax=Belliella buryatensis TaxID=1500549 RepID=A0A239GUU6_9BACT|nr:serine acetyltransferase [Belliella buryatensis]SNS72568.1 serine O-acetyltransferase [Belliella buryatensis]